MVLDSPVIHFRKECIVSAAFLFVSCPLQTMHELYFRHRTSAKITLFQTKFNSKYIISEFRWQIIIDETNEKETYLDKTTGILWYSDKRYFQQGYITLRNLTIEDPSRGGLFSCTIWFHIGDNSVLSESVGIFQPPVFFFLPCARKIIAS